MVVGQRATFQAPDPFPPELMRMLGRRGERSPCARVSAVLAEHNLVL
jgi:hypothetical protein